MHTEFGRVCGRCCALFNKKGAAVSRSALLYAYLKPKLVIDSSWSLFALTKCPVFLVSDKSEFGHA